MGGVVLVVDVVDTGLSLPSIVTVPTPDAAVGWIVSLVALPMTMARQRQ